jgi:hypothetical protein
MTKGMLELSKPGENHKLLAGLVSNGTSAIVAARIESIGVPGDLSLAVIRLFEEVQGMAKGAGSASCQFNLLLVIVIQPFDTGWCLRLPGPRNCPSLSLTG